MKHLMLLLMLGLSLVACSHPVSQSAQVNQGFGGTGHSSSDEAGFGGTGQLALDESGFGGTGVIGTIEAFGSIWVNGLHIQFDHQQMVSANIAGDYAIGIGQQVLLSAQQKGQQIHSTELRLHFPLAGEVSEIRRQHFLINQQWVRWNANTQLDANWSSPEKIKLGDKLIVSGYQLDSGTWVATRLSANPLGVTHFDPEIVWPFGERPQRFVIEPSLASNLSPRLQQLAPSHKIMRTGRFSFMKNATQSPAGGQSGLQKGPGYSGTHGQKGFGGTTHQAPMMGGSGGSKGGH